MEKNELICLIDEICSNKYESERIELKSSRQGSTKKFYDTLSSFSNTRGGIILFGIDETKNFEVCGVYNAQDQQKVIEDLCKCMEPIVRPIISIAEYSKDKFVIAAEINEMESIDKPCFYKPLGLYKGSFTRVGDSDETMTELEINQFLAYKRNEKPELEAFDNLTERSINEIAENQYLLNEIKEKPNFANQSKDIIKEMLGLTKNGKITFCSLINFGIYPQEIAPMLTINCVKVRGREYINENNIGERFVANKSYSGNISQMYDSAMSFIKNNMEINTIIAENGSRNDTFEYPIIALREAILNALIHRDYSPMARNIPISIIMYDNRIEISNPGSILGNYDVEDLGKQYLPVRNPFIARICESALETENRHSGILAMKAALKANKQLPPLFEDKQGFFKVTFYREKFSNIETNEIYDQLLSFCRKERSKDVLAEHFGYSDKRATYFFNTYVKPLIEKEILFYTIPEKINSKFQKIKSFK